VSRWLQQSVAGLDCDLMTKKKALFLALGVWRLGAFPKCGYAAAAQGADVAGSCGLGGSMVIFAFS
jgi:hypothetical protein